MSASRLVRAAAVAALIAGAELDNHTLVLVIGLPKSGTISLQRFFASADCGARAASHYTCGPKGSPTEYCGAAIRANLEAGVAPLLGLEAFDVHTELDYLGDGGGGGPECFFPQVDALEALVDGYPSATLVLALEARSIIHLDAGELRGETRACRRAGSLATLRLRSTQTRIIDAASTSLATDACSCVCSLSSCAPEQQQPTAHPTPPAPPPREPE